MTAVRVTQEVVEVSSSVSPNVRTSQVVAEAISYVNPVARVSGVVAEALNKVKSNIRVSGIVVEVLSSSITEEEPAPSGSYRKRWGGVEGSESIASYSRIW